MLKGIFGRGAHKVRACAAAAALGLIAMTMPGIVKAEDGPGAAFSFSGGTDVTSHFISYGVDVWGGGRKS